MDGFVWQCHSVLCGQDLFLRTCIATGALWQLAAASEASDDATDDDADVRGEPALLESAGVTGMDVLDFDRRGREELIVRYPFPASASGIWPSTAVSLTPQPPSGLFVAGPPLQLPRLWLSTSCLPPACSTLHWSRPWPPPSVLGAFSGGTRVSFASPPIPPPPHPELC